MQSNPQAHPLARPLGFWLVLLVVLAGIFVWRTYFYSGAAGRDGAVQPGVGKRVDFLKLEPLTGDAEPFAADNFRGKITLVNFWGPWCPPCRIEFPHLYELRQSYTTNDDVQFVFVSCSRKEGIEDNGEQQKETTAEFLAKQKADVPTHHDPFTKSRRSIMEIAQMEQFGYPTTVIVDGRGIIRGIWQGYLPGDEVAMHRLLETLAAETLTPYP